jgi:hypothetical protein
MAFKASTKAVNVLNEAIRTALATGAIYVYEGSQPANPNAAPGSTLLGIITVGAGAWTAVSAVTNGLDFAASSAGVMTKSTSETWQMVGIAAGTAGWFRHVAGGTADSLTTDTSTYFRLDGRCGTAGSGAELILSDLSVTVGKTITVDSYYIDWPPEFYQ